jgi:hypothetical protein
MPDAVSGHSPASREETAVSKRSRMKNRFRPAPTAAHMSI